LDYGCVLDPIYDRSDHGSDRQLASSLSDLNVSSAVPERTQCTNLIRFTIFGYRCVVVLVVEMNVQVWLLEKPMKNFRFVHYKWNNMQMPEQF
jgi:hypothetical protein